MEPGRGVIAAHLDRFAPADAREGRALAEMRAALRAPADPTVPTTMPGHFTAAGLVVAAEPPARVLLILHRKLELWLPPGGHLDAGDESDPARAAVREVREETGVEAWLHPDAPAPFDLDAHTIPARPEMPEHRHLDVRFLLVADARATLRRQEEETLDVRWAALSEELMSSLSSDLAAPLRRAWGLAPAGATALRDGLRGRRPAP